MVATVRKLHPDLPMPEPARPEVETGRLPLSADERRALTAEAGLGVGLAPDPDRVYRIDPRALVLGPNVRAETLFDPEFAQSLAVHGVLQPIVGYLDDGEVVVEIGNRRTLNAVAVGLVEVPVLIRPKPDGVQRISDQVHENVQRVGLTTGEQAVAAQQLSAFGLPAAAVAAELAMRPDDVATALRVAGNTRVAQVAHQRDLTLDQAAALVEFDHSPEVAETLLDAIDDPTPHGSFEHVLQAAREERRDQDERDAEAARLRAGGLAILEERPGPPAVYLAQLGITAADHAQCTGHAAVLMRRWDPTAAGGQGDHSWLPTYLCTDGATHHPRGDVVQLDLAAEQQRAEREHVVRINREWRTAEVVRRRWLAELAERKSPPPAAERFVLLTLLHCDHALQRAMQYDRQHQLYRDLRGLARLTRDDAGYSASVTAEIGELAQAAVTASSKRAAVMLVALVLAALEEDTSVQTWRTPREQDRAYWRQLVEWGYRPSPVERRYILDPEPDDSTAGDP